MNSKWIPLFIHIHIRFHSYTGDYVRRSNDCGRLFNNCGRHPCSVHPVDAELGVQFSWVSTHRNPSNVHTYVIIRWFRRMFPQPVLTGLPVSPTYRVTEVFLRNLDDAILRIPPTPTTNVKRRKGTCVGQGRALLGCITVRPMKDVWHGYSESVLAVSKYGPTIMHPGASYQSNNPV